MSDPIAMKHTINSRNLGWTFGILAALLPALCAVAADARAAGIKPVLVTSLSRRQWGPDGKIHSTLQPNADVVKQIAAEKNVPLIDLHARSIELYEKLGKEAVNKLSPKKTPKGDKAEQG